MDLWLENENESTPHVLRPHPHNVKYYMFANTLLRCLRGRDQNAGDIVCIRSYVVVVKTTTKKKVLVNMDDISDVLMLIRGRLVG